MQNKSLFKWLTVGVVLLVLIVVNLSIFQKEQLLEQGQVVILELAPVDPRSLMQGDYMALDYALARQLGEQHFQQLNACMENTPPCTQLSYNGKIIVEIDAQHRAINAAFYQGQTLHPEEVLMKYHLSVNTLSIGTPSYFFQEGQAERFAEAHYGEFRVDSDGTALLTYLLDKQGKRIIP